MANTSSGQNKFSVLSGVPLWAHGNSLVPSSISLLIPFFVQREYCVVYVGSQFLLDNVYIVIQSIMQLWNTNDEFRREYVRCNTRSTLRRLRTLDGRSLGPDEEPPVIPSVFNKSASKMNSSPAHSTLEQEDKAASAVVNSEVKPVSKELVQSSLPPKTKKPAKPLLLEKSLIMASSLEEEDVKEEPRRMTEEEELILRRAEEKRKEEEAARLKEQRRLEEIAKAKEAMLRKQRNADRAQQRAALRAQKEAEQKQKEREKKARKKQRRKASAAEIVDNAEESMPALEEDETRIDEVCEKPVEVTKRQQKPSQMLVRSKRDPLLRFHKL